jgi:hypothetical protein
MATAVAADPSGGMCFFDLETTGLTSSAELKCAVFYVAGAFKVFYTIEETVDFIVNSAATQMFVGWNSMAFDFRFLVDRVTDTLTKARIAAIALNRHFDMMLDFTTAHGYYAGMDSFGQMIGATKTWNGKEAAESDDIKAVVEYCCADVKILDALWTSAMRDGYLKRKTVAGRESVWVLFKANTLRTPNTCLAAWKLAPPDQSWMTASSDLPNVVSMVEWAVKSIEAVLTGA